MNKTEDPDVSHNVPSSNLLKEEANSKGENDSDDDERSFRRRSSTIDPASSSKLEKNPIILREKPMYFTKKTVLIQDRIGKSFQEILIFLDGLFHHKSRDWRRKWYVTSIRMTDKHMEPYIWDSLKSVLM